MYAASETGGYVIPQRYWAWIGARKAIAVLLWAVALAVGSGILLHAIFWFDNVPTLPEERQRVDGNSGHAQIDFGGQWVMGRMVVKGYSHELYHRQRQWEIVREAFPVEDEPPLCRYESIVPGIQRKTARAEENLNHDADRMMSWFMGSDSADWRVAGGAVVAPLATGLPGNPFASAALAQASQQSLNAGVVEKVNKPAIGGPLYPPVHAFLYAPLGLIDRPQVAYRVLQVAAALFVFLAGLGLSVLSRGRIWWSVGTLLFFLYPGACGGLDLGQNPTVTLTIAIWGWALASRGYNVAGGMVWGIFAFKPVWGLALFLVPVLTRRWRFCCSMVMTGLCLAIATLPFVGIQTWFDWFAVGQEAAALYNVNQNWISLSRDLQGIPRRILHDFSLPEAERDSKLAQRLAWGLWGTVLATTAAIYLRYGDRRRTIGVGIAFLFFGAFLTCYRFMFYDVLVSSVGFAALLAEPARYFRGRVFGLALESRQSLLTSDRTLDPPAGSPTLLGSKLLGYVNSFPLTILAALIVFEKFVSGLALQATLAFGYYTRTTTAANGTTGVTVPKVVGDTGTNYPTETFLILAIWIWCAWKLIRGEERQVASPQPVQITGMTSLRDDLPAATPGPCTTEEREAGAIAR